MYFLLKCAFKCISWTVALCRLDTATAEFSTDQGSFSLLERYLRIEFMMPDHMISTKTSSKRIKWNFLTLHWQQRTSYEKVKEQFTDIPTEHNGMRVGTSRSNIIGGAANSEVNHELLSAWKWLTVHIHFGNSHNVPALLQMCHYVLSLLASFCYAVNAFLFGIFLM